MPDVGVSSALVVFVMVSSLSMLVATLLATRSTRLDARLDDLSGNGRIERKPVPDPVEQLALTALPRLGAPLVPSDEEERTLLQARLIHAGLYSRQAMAVFFGVKILLMTGPALVGLFGGLSGVCQLAHGVLVGSITGALGMIGPSLWLDSKKKARQTCLRRALPDALDVLVICLEGGLSLSGALRYVAEDLRTAHPLLAEELNIAKRGVQLGLSPGESFRQLGQRTDLDEIRSLASVIIQADRLGASLVKTLRVHADTLRVKRKQRAEELAQKAGTKILFPTILFIFPALFVVILAPGLIQIMDMLKLVKS
jgi:tight adherence protein C